MPAAVDAHLDDYVAAWNTVEPAQRMLLLDRAMDPSATFTGPTGTFRGREAILELIEALQARMPGASVVRDGPVVVDEEGVIRFGWQIRRSNGGVVMEGVDEVETAADGRIALVRMHAGAGT